MQTWPCSLFLAIIIIIVVVTVVVVVAGATAAVDVTDVWLIAKEQTSGRA